MVRTLMIGLGLTCALAVAAPAAAGPDGLKTGRGASAQACKTARGAALDTAHCFSTPLAAASARALARIGIEPPRGFGPRRNARARSRAGRTGPGVLNGGQRGRALRLELTPRSAALKISW